MKFKMEIELGNDGMKRYGDLCFVVRRAVFPWWNVEEEINETDNRVILDVNGNTVGSWSIME